MVEKSGHQGQKIGRTSDLSRKVTGFQDMKLELPDIDIITFLLFQCFNGHKIYRDTHGNQDENAAE